MRPSEGMTSGITNKISIGIFIFVLINILQLSRTKQFISAELNPLGNLIESSTRSKSKVAQMAEANLSGDGVMKRNGQHKQQNA